MVWDRIPVGTRFSALQDHRWGPLSLLCNGYQVFPGGRGGRGVGLTPPPHLVPKGPRKSRAIPLLTLRACVAYKKGENLPTHIQNKTFFLNHHLENVEGVSPYHCTQTKTGIFLKIVKKDSTVCRSIYDLVNLVCKYAIHCKA
jgi:hypothetical protein